MLDLQSARWSQLKSHFGDSPRIPQLIGAWKAAIGTAQEESLYSELFEHYLHQLTILSCAYAVVPHVVAELPRVSKARRLEYLCDVAQVEMSRLPRPEVDAMVEDLRRSEEIPDELRDHFVEAARDRHPELPDDLAQAYLSALAEAKSLAIALLQEPWRPEDFARLLGVLTGLFAKQESNLAGALLNPTVLYMESEYEGKTSISVLLSNHAPE
jgi:hypothetical protein